jgi:hypothetical protein
MTSAAAITATLARGWNTWNTRSVLSHVLLPEGFALDLGFKEYRNGLHLDSALIGRRPGEGFAEQVRPGAHAWDGRYTECTVTWGGIQARVRSAVDAGDLVLLIEASHDHVKPPLLVVQAALLWNRPGALRRVGDALVAALPARELRVHAAQATVEDPYVDARGPYLCAALGGPVAFATRPIDLAAAQAAIARAEAAHRAAVGTGAEAEVRDAVQTCLAWDTVYDPLKDRVITTVSRRWNRNWGGYVLFCWDTYFAAWMAVDGSKALAYANAIAITEEVVERGFVPNYAAATGSSSRDRSQPPVGALTVRELYRAHRERWLVEALYPRLERWNRWWTEARQVDGTLRWGSNPYQPVTGNEWEYPDKGVGGRFGGALESGLDNSPMYDGIPVDAGNRLLLEDVGLTAFFIADCAALADLARVLGRDADVVALDARRAEAERGLRSLWSEEHGMFLNRRADTGAFQTRLSPFHFLPLLTDVPTPAQARRMMATFNDPAKFAGEWMLPSIMRDDPAYPEQEYWRGRIWAPMNFLAYLGLRRHRLDAERATLVDSSRRLLLKEWRSHGHVHENYCAETGVGCDKASSDAYYHWGALLGFIDRMERGEVAGPETPL